MKKTALIMAGGKGERFWPKSRQSLPKQFLSLTNDGKTMIQLTVERILPLVSLEDIYIATNTNYKHLVLEQLPGIPAENILCEPVGRNTAPCIGLGAVHIQRKYEDAIMIVLPSDHLIKYNDIFTETLANACDVAEINANLVTIGITPNYPETGYGYIKADKNKQLKKTYSVERFVEKPDFNLAKTYVESGDYYWNSGMFIWKASTILSYYKKLLPDIYECLMKLEEGFCTPGEEALLWEVYPAIPKISVDYGIMERADHVLMLTGDFGWSDVGGWDAFDALKSRDENGNLTVGKTLLLDSRNCTAYSVDKLIAAVGVEDLIIVQAGEAVLVCPQAEAQRVKEIVEALSEKGENSYL